MELFVHFQRLMPFLALSFLVLNIISVEGQLNSPCSASMITSFTPCVNFITNSSANGTSPTADCCNFLRSLTGSGVDCLCLIVTGSVPFQLPINRTLAISLPRACNIPGVPVQCQASVAPIPAPGPVAFGPTLSPGASPSDSPKASAAPQPTSPALAPGAETTPDLTPPSAVESDAPTSTTGLSRPVPTPSAAVASFTFSPFLLLLILGYVV